MKISVETLNRYLKKRRSTDELIELINRTEIEVEEIIRSNSLDPRIILAKTTDVQPHPNADRLRLVTVTLGTKKVQVVCGAPNVAVEQRVALVQPGAILPDGTEIESATIRGVKSYGMLASPKELGLSDDHSGILVLEEDKHKLGTSLCDIVFSGDVLDIKTPANRWDYLSGVGIARELAAYDSDGQGVVDPVTTEYTYQKTENVIVKETGEAQRFLSAHVRIRNDVKSPAWLVDNLEANGFVTHNPVVDITNYVMLETGQPSHAYDFAKLSGPLAVRFARDGEKITTLDDVERTLTSEDLIIADNDGAVGLAGIMGSAHTQVDERTTEILLEAAHFQKARIRQTAIRHGLRTEASARFERGLPLPLSAWAFGRLLELLQEICHAEIIDGPFDQLYGWPWQQFLGVRLRVAERFLGLEIPEKMAIQRLRKLGFSVDHFSLSKELKQHLGKPYVWGANFREHGETAFDCSYLVDRVFSKLGVFVGHTALGQFHTGEPIEVTSLKPGDVVFVEGKIEKSTTDSYYLMNPDGTKTKHTLKKPMKVGHNGIYIGNGQVIHAATYKHRGGEWVKRRQTGVITSPLKEFTEDPGYLGARRYLKSLNHILAVEAPWWRTDIRLEVDMYEELAKIVGYDTMPETLPDLAPMSAESQSLLVAQMKLRQQMIAAGGTEVATYSFISQVDAELTHQSLSELPKIANPRSPEQTYLRSTMLSSHLRTWERNRAIKAENVLFEFSRVFSGNGRDGVQPKETWRLALSTSGQGAIDRLRGYFHHVASLLKLEITFHSIQDSNLVPQRSAEIRLADKAIGCLGQVRSSISTGFGLQQAVAWAEIDFEPLLTYEPNLVMNPVPDYQLVTRDMSLELADVITWQQINSVLKAQKQVFRVDYLSQFTDEQLAVQQRHVVTLRLWIDAGAQPNAKNITKRVEGYERALKHLLPDEAELIIR